MASSSPPSQSASHTDSNARDTPTTNTTVVSVGDTAQVAAQKALARIAATAKASAVDPFSATAIVKSSTALMATAKDFEPGKLQFGGFHVLTPVPASIRPDLGQAGSALIPFNNANADELVQAMAKVTLSAQLSPDNFDHFRFSTVNEGSFSIESTFKRAFKITGRSESAAESFQHLGQMFTSSDYPTYRGGQVVIVDGVASLYVRFGDFRDAVRAFSAVHNGRWRVEYLAPKVFELAITPTDEHATAMFRTTNFDGRIKVCVSFNPQNEHLTSAFIVPCIKEKLMRFGDLKAIRSAPNHNARVKVYDVEYYNIVDADRAVTEITRNGEMRIIDDLSMTAHFNMDDTLTMVDQNLPRLAIEQPSQTGRSMVPFNDPSVNGQWNVARYGGRGAHMSSGYASGQSINHNQVDVERIRMGRDVRTTVMLRNIPNRVDQRMLKEILDETSRGQYDFMYLRIDFANNCNVGYAFINFEDPEAIIPFHVARAHQRWNRFGSDKVAEISYATIQGRDCLIQKFRNSSVMLEHPTFRPKLYTTGDSITGGEEEQFPGPDNQFKMRRSVENAETVGLFAPRHGQQYRDDQRRRRSQFDRGTTAAENEARFEGLFDPARVSHSGTDLRSFGAHRFEPGMYHSH